MKNYVIFLKKELVESAKTYKLLIMGAVFLIFGMLSPFSARYMPEILKWAMESDPATAGMDFGTLMTTPVAFDSWAQFYSNVGTMGFIALVAVFSNMISSEMSRGTLTILLSKGLSRATIMYAKITSAIIIWTCSFCLSFLTAWGYTLYFFEDKVSNLFLSMFCLWVFGVFLIALTAFFAAITNKGYACMFSVGGVVISLSLFNIISQIEKISPMSLSGRSIQLLNDSLVPKDFIVPIIIAFISIVVFILLSVLFFNKKKKSTN